MNVGVTLQLFHSPSRVMRIVYILLPLRVGYHKCSINRILPKRPRRWGNRNEIEEYWVNPNISACNINFSVTRAQLLISFYQSRKRANYDYQSKTNYILRIFITIYK